MTWPTPQPGLVIRYSYLWHWEWVEGELEHQTSSACALILAVQDGTEGPRVFALPIVHTPPADGQTAIELPAALKVRLGLNAERSWIVLDEFNDFTWPGPDLRLLPGKGPESAAYGLLPPRLFRAVRERFLATIRTKQAARVARTG